MATSGTQEERSRRRRLTVAVIVLLWLIAYWPGGPLLEQALSPAAFLIWVVLVIPAVAVIIFAYNGYRNIQIDRELEGGTGGDSG